MNSQNIGSSFDDWLREEGLYKQVSVVAIKRVLARQTTQGGEHTMNRRTLFQSLGATLMLHPALTSLASSDVTSSTVYELRVYHLNPGKLPLILDRFRTKETAIFTRCGMHNVAFWTPTDDPGNAETAGNTLVYMLRHASREAARASWAKFSADPEWIALKTETEKNGAFVDKIESTFLALTDFSPSL